MFRFRCLASFVSAAHLFCTLSNIIGTLGDSVTLPSSVPNNNVTYPQQTSVQDNSYFSNPKYHHGANDNVTHPQQEAVQDSSFFSNPKYHHGAMMTSPIHLYIIWYGYWGRADKIIIRDFLNSFVTPPPPLPPPPPPPSPPPPPPPHRKRHKKHHRKRPPPSHPPTFPPPTTPHPIPPSPSSSPPRSSPLPPSLTPAASASSPQTPPAAPQRRLAAAVARAPTVAQWWSSVHEYKNGAGRRVGDIAGIRGEVKDSRMSFGKKLTRNSTGLLVQSKLRRNRGPFPFDPSAIYLVLSSPKVKQEDFCSSQCSFHGYQMLGRKALKYLWSANPAAQCLKYCGFPFVIPSYVKYSFPAFPPNHKRGIDSMLGSMGHELVEAATDPTLRAWYIGDRAYPGEVADLCQGIYATDAGPAFPGTLHVNPDGSNFNVRGVHNRTFLLPWLWSNKVAKCVGGGTAWAGMRAFFYRLRKTRQCREVLGEQRRSMLDNGGGGDFWSMAPGKSGAIGSECQS